MMRPTPSAASVATPVDSLTRENGVYFVDAADGYVGLAVYIGRRRVVKLEIAEDYYSSKWFRWFETFVRKNAPAALKLVD